MILWGSQPSFFDFAQPVGRVDRVAGFGKRSEVPYLLMVERGGILSATEENVLHGGQVVLKAVEAAGQQARAERGLEHVAFKLHAIALTQAAGAFVHLHEGVLAGDLDDFGHHLRAAQIDVADLVLGHVSVEADGDQVGNDSGNNTSGFHCMSIVFVQRRRPGKCPGLRRPVL